MNLKHAMALALQEAYAYEGTTAPNPPVGAVGLDAEGRILARAGHAGAGLPHAEALVVATCKEHGTLNQLHTVVVTLEPCNHFGRTPPCSELLKDVGIKRLVYGVRDTNPKAGGGLETLREAGIEVVESELAEQCAQLLAPFKKHVEKGVPFVTIKRAKQENGSMIPPQGQKTFTSDAALDFAHQLRKRSDAIITGSGTVLADNPLFTVRRVEDHPDRQRHLLVMDRRDRVPAAWYDQAQENGFIAQSFKGSFQEALKMLGDAGCLRVLVEAGPSLSDALLNTTLWDEDIVIQQGAEETICITKQGA